MPPEVCRLLTKGSIRPFTPPNHLCSGLNIHFNRQMKGVQHYDFYMHRYCTYFSWLVLKQLDPLQPLMDVVWVLSKEYTRELTLHGIPTVKCHKYLPAQQERPPVHQLLETCQAKFQVYVIYISKHTETHGQVTHWGPSHPTHSSNVKLSLSQHANTHAPSSLGPISAVVSILALIILSSN